MGRRIPHSLFLLAILLVIGCTPREIRPPGDWVGAREGLFAEHTQWRVSGRMGLSDGQRQGSLAFDWRADGQQHRIVLRTGAGGRQWRLEYGPGYALLEGSEIDPLIGTTPEPLVETALGWPIPVRLMSRWIRGLPAPPDALLEFREDGTLARLVHEAWTLDYSRHRDYRNMPFPDRMEARRGSHRVRVVIGSWTLED